MIARPALVILALCAMGALALFVAAPTLPPPGYLPALLGAFIAFAATAWLLRELRRRDRWAISLGIFALGFLAAIAGLAGPYPWVLSFAAAFLPAYLLFLGGVGRERLSFELARLENESDDPTLRPRAIARASAILEQAKSAARSLDPDAKSSPSHAGDPRAVYAYASQVVAYAEAQNERFGEAVRVLGEVPLAWMPNAMRALMVSNIAFFHLCEGDAAAALAALEKLPEAKAPGQGRAALRVMRAAALAQKGDASAALELIGRDEDDAGEPDRLRPRYAIVRAYALALEGEREAAQAELARALATPEGRDESKKWRALGKPLDEMLALSGSEAGSS